MSETVTIEELNKFYNTLLDKYKYDNNKLQLKKEQILLTNVEYPINKCYVKKSNIHGNGLYAKVSLKKREIITFYPCHVLKLIPQKNRSEKHKAGFIFSKLIDNDYQKKIMDNREYYYGYSVDVNDTYSIIGLPEISNDPSHLGHFSNDGARGHTPKDKNIYDNVTMIKSNAGFEIICDCQVAVIAIKDINVDEEILTIYGHDYWLSSRK